MALDFDATAHLFVRMRVWHPLLAVSFAVAMMAGTRALAATAHDAVAARWARI
jgi:hypothetical protein